MLKVALAVIGPPAVGKTTLTSQLGKRAGCGIFCMPEFQTDNFTVIASAHTYIESLIREGRIHTLLLDGFPCTGTQVSLFLSLLRQLAPGCAVLAVELRADPVVLASRKNHHPNYEAHRRRYDEFSAGTQRAFTAAGIAVTQLDTDGSVAEAAQKLTALIARCKRPRNAS
jgi:adenylate kinase family enzyme